MAGETHGRGMGTARYVWMSLNCLLWCCFLACVHLPFITAPLMFCFVRVQVFWFSQSLLHLQDAPCRCIHLGPLYLIFGTNFHMTITYTDTDWLTHVQLNMNYAPLAISLSQHSSIFCTVRYLYTPQCGLFVWVMLFGNKHCITVKNKTNNTYLNSTVCPRVYCWWKKENSYKIFTAIRTFGKCIREINTTFG
jgi:hypothetical protein